MTYLFVFITAMALSMAIIPVMARFAPRLHMIDKPSERKVHAVPIPRVGGLGIVIGALLPLLLWLPIDDRLRAYLFGAVVLLVFGVWDDVRELDHYVKFIGQFVAAVVAVYYGGVYVATLPFMDLAPLPPALGKPFTVIAIVGVINAINHSDGLDGLAGGESLLSLGCLAYLAYLSDGVEVMAIALATIGGVFGFLRYNSHPARVFMGDGGSQFLGFTLAFLTVLLLQEVNPVLSPALPLLILGLPLFDILTVLGQRIYGRMNWFRATKNHIHHRLLALDFDHYEAVLIIYGVQAFFVVSALLLVYESDVLITLVYLGACSALFVGIYALERLGWRAHQAGSRPRLARIIEHLKQRGLLTWGPLRFILFAVPAFLIAGGFLVARVPQDISIAAGVLLITLLTVMFLNRHSGAGYLRAAIYVTLTFLVYLLENYPGPLAVSLGPVMYVYFGALAIAVLLSVRYSTSMAFKITPLDFLVVLIVLLVGIVPQERFQAAEVQAVLIKLLILFYASEVIISRLRGRWNGLTVSAFFALAVLTMRGFV